MLAWETNNKNYTEIDVRSCDLDGLILGIIKQKYKYFEKMWFIIFI